MMSPHDFAIYSATLCGIMMVAGSIYLLATGAIKLADANAPGGSGVTVEFANQMKITTQYPALGLFIIGLVFVTVALYSSQVAEPITLEGKVTIDDPGQLKFSVDADIPTPIISPDDNGNLQVSFRPEFQQLTVNVKAPTDYLPSSHSESVRLTGRQTYTLPNQMLFTRMNVQNPIAAVPSGVQLAPFVPAGSPPTLPQ